MKQSEIKSVIANIAPELRASGIGAIYLFGSQARGDFAQDSDIDLAFDVSDEVDERFSVLDQARLMVRLEELLGKKVDFCERSTLRPRIRQRVEAEMVRVL
jgi:uncharacterized protein